MGDKITAKDTVAAVGVPVVPGIARPGLTDDELIAAADEVGYPVLVKPSAGGGGKGMRLVERPRRAARRAGRAPAREAAAAFGDDTLFLERFVLRPTAHRGAGAGRRPRQRHPPRRARVQPAAPAPEGDRGGAVAPAGRRRPGRESAAAACDTARSVDYAGAGTVEFIVSADQPDEFFFMEMNTRLQVEHPVTELVTGMDLVEWQVRIAAGEQLASPRTTSSSAATRSRPGCTPRTRRRLPADRRDGARLSEPTRPLAVRVDSGLSSRHRGR